MHNGLIRNLQGGHHIHIYSVWRWRLGNVQGGHWGTGGKTICYWTPMHEQLVNHSLSTYTGVSWHFSITVWLWPVFDKPGCFPFALIPGCFPLRFDNRIIAFWWIESVVIYCIHFMVGKLGKYKTVQSASMCVNTEYSPVLTVILKVISMVCIESSALMTRL